MEIFEFIGTWENETGNVLEITTFKNKSLKVNFISGKTSRTVTRPYFENKKSINMHATLDFYESSLQVELGKKGTGFQLILLYDLIYFKNGASEYCLAPGLSQYESSNLAEQFGYLFDPLEYYKKTENCP